MKRLITILAASLFILVTAHGQVPTPQITLTGNIGAGFVGPLFNSGNLVYATDANRTMAYPETSAFIIKVTSTVSLTATRNLIAPVGYFPFVIENLTTGGQSIQFIGTSGTGITIPNGSAAFIAGDGTNYFSLTGSGGGGSGVASINGTTGAFTFTGSGVSCTSTTCTFSGSGAPSFSSITSGTNTTGLVMGSGGVLSYSGTGFINANELLGVALPTIATGYLNYNGSAWVISTISSSGTVNSGTAFSPAYYASTGTAVSGVTPFNGIGYFSTAAAPAAATSAQIQAAILPALTTLSGATPAITATNPLQTITLSANATATVTGIATGVQVRMQICQPATGGPWTWTWPTAIHGGIVIGTTASTCSTQTFNSFNGTTLVPEGIGAINVAP